MTKENTTRLLRPSRAYVAFWNHGAGPWTRFLRPGFRHCLVILDCGEGGVAIDPLLRRMDVHLIVGPVRPVLARLEHMGAIVTPAPLGESAPHWRNADCMRVARRLLGLGPFWPLTPFSLYCRFFPNCSNKVLDALKSIA